MPSAPPSTEGAGRLPAYQPHEPCEGPSARAIEDLAALAVQLTGAPVAIVSLEDDSHYWFQARQGSAGSRISHPRVLRATATQLPTPLVAEGAAGVSLTADQPLVAAGPEIGFYAVFPLELSDGATLGTLSVIDTQSRTLSVEETGALRALARQAADYLGLRRAFDDLRLRHQQAQHSADRNLETNVQESVRVGQFLRDDLANKLVEITRSVRTCVLRTQAQDASLRAALVDASEQIAETALICREVAGRFRHFALLTSGWLETARADISRLESKHNVRIVLDTSEDPDQCLSYAAAHHLSEFVYTALSTAVEQRGAHKLRLALTKRGGALHMTITHDGIAAIRTPSGLHPASRMRVLAAELESVVHECQIVGSIEIRLSVELSSPLHSAV